MCAATRYPEAIPPCKITSSSVVIALTKFFSTFGLPCEEHLHILEQVLARLARASLTLNLAKCDFGKATVTYLGRQVGQGPVKPLTAKPLTALMSPKVDFVWSSTCQHAFYSAKSLLSHASVLAAPDFSCAFKQEVDASATGAGAVLLQVDIDGVDHPVCYFSLYGQTTEGTARTGESNAKAATRGATLKQRRPYCPEGQQPGPFGGFTPAWADSGAMLFPGKRGEPAWGVAAKPGQIAEPRCFLGREESQHWDLLLGCQEAVERSWWTDMEPAFCFESRNNSCLKKNSPMPLRVTLYFIIGVIIILTVCGNFLVTFSIAYFKQLHTPTNYLILSLAMSDLLVGMVVMFPNMIRLVESCWYFGDFLCNICLSFNVSLITASIINLSFISIDRYYAVCHPLLYRTRISTNVVLIMILLCWTISPIIGFGMIFMKLNILGIEEFYYNHFMCEGQCALVQGKISSTVSSIVSFYLPAIILLGVYLKIFLVAQRQFKNIKNAGCVNSVKTSNKSQTKATKTLAIVMGAFLSCWTPLFVCVITNPYVSNSIPQLLLETLVWLGYFNSAMNPIIYAFFYSWFRKAFQLITSGSIFKSDLSETKLFTE
ncbi:trace amine-associated receptor 1-like [Cheilinus undulatus]|uniref:trace amine-associated receptor 1-like n=1 Tax=Cheilinus undulatus TaxID=241271 RepID=UPI001BD6333B|nr:trace amine-associated receptor 1-like [Cheilinus undulatus]